MYTSLMLVALSGYVAQAEAIPSSWINDYNQACTEVQKHRRPLAVFLAGGPEGWDKVVKEGELGKDAQALLSNNYIRVFIDTTDEKGKRLARQFDIPDGRGLVISDVSGEKQAFWHAGTLSNQDLEHYLRRFADTDRVLVATESPARPQPVVGTTAPAFAPVYQPSHAPAASFIGGRNC